MKQKYEILEAFLFIGLGGIIYCLIEILYRGYSHYSMFLCGGIVFYCISLFNRRYNQVLSLITRMFISSLIITVIEFIFGILFNLVLKQNIWDYSNQIYNYKGQICLAFSVAWFFLSLPALYLEQQLRIFFHKMLQ